MKYTIKTRICQVLVISGAFSLFSFAYAQKYDSSYDIKYEAAKPDCCSVAGGYFMSSSDDCRRAGGSSTDLQKCIDSDIRDKKQSEPPKRYALDEAAYARLRKNLSVSVSAFSRYGRQLDMNAPKLKGTDFEKTWQQLTAITKAQKENFQDFRFFLISSPLGPEDRAEINNRLEAIKNNTLAIQAELRVLEKKAQSKKGWLAIAAGKQGELEMLEQSARANINRLDKEIIEMEKFKNGLYKLQAVPPVSVK